MYISAYITLHVLINCHSSLLQALVSYEVLHSRQDLSKHSSLSIQVDGDLSIQVAI